MNKIATLFTTLCIVFSTLGTFTVFAENTAPSGHSINAYVTSESLNGNWENTSVKVFSRQELNDCLITIFGEYAPKFEQYDEEFFKDKFLYLAFLTSGNPKKINVTSISEGANMIVIKTALEYIDPAEEYRENFVVAEIDKRLSDREITVSLTDLTKYDIAYFEGSVNDMQLEDYIPCVKFITSSDELKNCTDNTEVQSRYRDLNFDEDCLLLVAWNEPRQVRARSIANIEYYTIILSEAEPNEYCPEVVTPYFAAVKLPKYMRYINYGIQVRNMYSVNDYIYKINNIDDLIKFRDTVNLGYDYESTIVTLNADIDLSSVCGGDINGEAVSWTPIGAENLFDGTFNGNGHTISGLYIDSEYADVAGVFGGCGQNSQILNLVVDGFVKAGYPDDGVWANPPVSIGGVAGSSIGKIANCHNKATITGIGNGAIAAGICVYGGVVENCINTGLVVSDGISEAIAALGSDDNCKNCYYLTDTSAYGSGAQAKTAEQFESGEVAYLLGDEWGQKIGIDKYPVISGDKVYFVNNTYTNTKPKYPYEITGLRFTDTNGNEIIAPEQGKSFIVEADITKTRERDEKDYLFVAVYDTNDVLLNIDYVKAKFAVDGECSFSFYAPAQDKEIGSIKAFVWNAFNSMEPLAESKIIAPIVFE